MLRISNNLLKQSLKFSFRQLYRSISVSLHIKEMLHITLQFFVICTLIVLSVSSAVPRLSIMIQNPTNADGILVFHGVHFYRNNQELAYCIYDNTSMPQSGNCCTGDTASDPFYHLGTEILPDVIIFDATSSSADEMVGTNISITDLTTSLVIWSDVFPAMNTEANTYTLLVPLNMLNSAFCSIVSSTNISYQNSEWACSPFSLVETDPCFWTGVECAGGLVTRLGLSALHLGGKLNIGIR